MVGIYLSGTGNTEHCVKRLVGQLDPKAACVPIEDNTVVERIRKEKVIVLGYPIQYSNLPVMVREFIKDNKELWQGKKVLCVVTMGMFSGDGAGCSARSLKKYGAEILGGLHLLMPDSIGDVGLLKKSREKNKKMIQQADEKIDRAVQKIKAGSYPKEGLNGLYHIAGLFGQRLWFYGKTKDYTDKIKVSETCTGCGLCQKICPMQNMEIVDGKAKGKDKCTMCYRCINSCPKQAITLLGKRVIQQNLYKNQELDE